MVSSAQNPADDPDAGVVLDPTVDTSHIFDSNPPESSWSPGNCFENGMGSEPQDFGNVLSQLGIGVPSNFWEMDRTAFTDMPEIDASFVNIGEDSTNNSQALEIGPLNDQTSVSPYKSPSSRSSGSLTNGKVSSIESLTRRPDNAGALHGSEPPAIYIRKNETAGHYVGQLLMKVTRSPPWVLTLRFIGLSSTGATLAICLTDGLKSQRLPLKPNGLDFLIEAGQRVDETNLASLLDLSSRELPPKDAAMCSIRGI